LVVTARRPPFKPGDPMAREVGAKGGKATAVQRRAEKGPWTGTIIDLMDHAGMVGADWLPWRSFWKAVYALPMSDDELAIFRKHTRRESPPAEQGAEAWMVIGRGGGKTRNSALHAVYRAITFDPRGRDDDFIIPLLASDRRQSRIALKYVRAFNALELVAPYVFRGTLRETCEYRTGVNIEVVTASKAAVRGYGSPSGNCDEVAWWENEDDHVNPDSEVIAALRGSLGRVVGSVLVVLSNPAAPRGELYEAVESYYGKDDPDVLVWNADTLSMNPTYDTRAIARAFKKDPAVATSEFGSGGFVTFRQARQACFDLDKVDAVIISGRRELPPAGGVKYYAFIDAASGARNGDSMTLAIAHGDGGRAVLDLVREVEPPFSPGHVISETFAPIIKEYGIREVRGDRYAVGFVAEFLELCGLTFVPSPHSKSELYAELLPVVNTALCELLDHPMLRTQLAALERRSVRGTRDSIDHPRGGHDDVANVAAGAVVAVTGVGAKKKPRAYASFGPGAVVVGRSGNPERDQNALMLELIRRTERALDRRAEREWKMTKAAEGLPMIGEPVFYPHQR
jgi:hypothetical protein